MFTRKLPKKETPERSLFSLLVEEEEAQKNNPISPAPTPEDKRFWRMRKRDKKKPTDTLTLFDGTPLARVCNAVLADAIDRKASVMTLTRLKSGIGVVEVTCEGEAVATQLLKLPRHLFERMVARYLMVAMAPYSTGGDPVFHQLAVVNAGKNYKVAVSITQEDEAMVMTLRIKDDI